MIRIRELYGIFDRKTGDILLDTIHEEHLIAWGGERKRFQVFTLRAILPGEKVPKRQVGSPPGHRYWFLVYDDESGRPSFPQNVMYPRRREAEIFTGEGEHVVKFVVV